MSSHVSTDIHGLGYPLAPRVAHAAPACSSPSLRSKQHCSLHPKEMQRCSCSAGKWLPQATAHPLPADSSSIQVLHKEKHDPAAHLRGCDVVTCHPVLAANRPLRSTGYRREKRCLHCPWVLIETHPGSPPVTLSPALCISQQTEVWVAQTRFLHLGRLFALGEVNVSSKPLQELPRR